MFRNAARKFVEFRNFASRNFSYKLMDPFAEHMTKNYAGYSVVLALVSAYTVGSFSVLRLQLRPIERIMTEMKLESKERIEKLGTESKERAAETKERIEKLDMKFDGLSKEIKESNDKMNSRVDSVLLRSLDLQRGPKPAGE